MPFIATENLLMTAVKKGGDRQTLHEVIRRNSMEQTARLKQGEEVRLLEALAEDEEFPLDANEIAQVMRPKDFIGRCEEQVTAYLESLDLSDGGEAMDENINL